MTLSIVSRITTNGPGRISSRSRVVRRELRGSRVSSSINNRCTHVWIYDDVFCVALRARHVLARSSFLLDVYPSLNTPLVNPLSGASAVARFHPRCSRVVFVGRKADPTILSTRIIHDFMKNLISELVLYLWIHILLVVQT